MLSLRRLLFCSLIALSSVCPAQADGKASPALPVIAVVDFAQVLENYPKALQERERLTTLRKGARDQVEALTKRMKELQDQLSLFPEGSMDRARRELDIETLGQQRPALAKLLNEQLALEEMKLDITLYEDAEFAVAKVAKDRGVQLVLRKMAELPPRGGDASPKETQARVMTYDRRNVWYVAPELDLTPHVIKFMQVPVERPNVARDQAAKPAGGN